MIFNKMVITNVFTQHYFTAREVGFFLSMPLFSDVGWRTIDVRTLL